MDTRTMTLMTKMAAMKMMTIIATNIARPHVNLWGTTWL